MSYKGCACISALRQDKNTPGASGVSVTVEPDGFLSEANKYSGNVDRDQNIHTNRIEACERETDVFLLQYYYCDCLCVLLGNFWTLYVAKHHIMHIVYSESSLHFVTLQPYSKMDSIVFQSMLPSGAAV